MRMSTAPFAEQSLGLVRQAVEATSKKHVAAIAGISDAILARLDDPDFSPHLRTLRKLEAAARQVLGQKEDA